MITDARASKLYRLLREGNSVADISRRLKMGQRTIRRYREANQLPSQIERPARTYRTRLDPLAKYWSEVEQLLVQDSQLKPYAILDWLKQKYNPLEGDPVVSDSIRRSLERRVQHWKLRHGVEQEVKFPQVHHAGDVLAFDFVVMNSLNITLSGKTFDHSLFHSVFTYSNWEHVHLCYSESFEALSTGLQDALYLAGGVPRRIRSDSLSAAVNNLSSDKEFAKQYRDLLDHYGAKGHRINTRKPHENGDVESSHGHLKDAIDQALRLRGNRDFANTDEYMHFVRQLIARRNTSRQARFVEELATLEPLPAQRRSTCTSILLTVNPDSVIRVKRNSYSISSKYVGLQLEVQIHQDHLELWYRGECVERLPRQFGYGKEAIDFRHVIDSLIRKPGAFVNYKYVNHMYPTTRFRMAYDQLRQSTTETSAVKQYLKLLHAAKHEGLELLDATLQWYLAEGKPIKADDILEVVRSQQQLPSVTDLNIEAPDLSLFDSLLQHKDVYDDQEDCPFDSPDADIQSRDGLTAYDRYIEAAGATEGTPASDLSGEPAIDSRAGSSRSLDAYAVPGGLGGEGVPGAQSEPNCSFNAQCQSTDWQDMGSVQMVSPAVAYHAAVRDPAQWGLLESPGQCSDFWETRFGENDVAICTGRAIGKAGTVGMLHHLPDVGAGTVARQTRSAIGAVDQKTQQVRSLDNRRPGLCSTDSRGDGSAIHTALGALRTRQCVAQFESAVQQMGTDLQGSHDYGRSGRSLDSSLRDHRATQHRELSTRDSRGGTGQIEGIKKGNETLGTGNLNSLSNCR